MKRKQGISLIVLVITIIVMIILAASVVITLSNAGIINKASEATDVTNLQQVQQLATLTWSDGFLDNLRGDDLRDYVLGEMGDYTDDYDIDVTDKGVEVNKKGEGTPEPLDTKFFDFDYDSTTMTATLKGIKEEYQEVGYYDPARYNYPYPMSIIDDDGTKITDIVIPSKVVNPADSKEYTITAVADYAFATQNTYTTYTTPDFTSLVLPDTITTVGVKAFHSWSKATKATIPSSITTTGDRAFEAWASLEKVYYDKDINSWLNDSPAAKTMLANGAALYLNGKLLTSVDLSSYTEIPDLLMYGCESLTGVTLSDSLTTIGWSAFNGCKKLTSISLPNTVTEIGAYAFSDCESLANVTLSTSLTTIPERAFQNCYALKSISIPSSVTTIEYQAFYFSGLESIIIPEGVEETGNYSFAYCESLKTVVIPTSLLTIGTRGFTGCTALTDIYYRGTEEEWIDAGFDSAFSTGTVHYEYTGN